MQAFSMLKKALTAICATFVLVSTNVQAQGELKGETLTIYLDISAPPMSYVSEDMRYPDGVETEIIYELQRRLGFNLKDNRIFPLAQDRTIELILENKADMIGGALSYTDERAKLFRYSPIYCSSGMSIMYSKKYSPDASNLSRLAGRTIAVVRNSTAEQYVRKILQDSTSIPIDNIISAYFKVANGEMDCVIHDRMPLVYFSKIMNHLDLVVSEDVFNQADSQYGFGFPKDSPYAKIISEEMLHMMNDGTMYNILSKWKK